MVNESCPGSVETMNLLTEALEAAGLELNGCGSLSPEEVRAAKIFLRQGSGGSLALMQIEPDYC